MGLHFNEPNGYRTVLRSFVARFANETLYPTSLYFMETLPQHFPTFPNGYFHKEVYHNLSDPLFHYADRGCKPIHLSEAKADELLDDEDKTTANPWKNDALHEVRDWRNDILHEVLDGTRWKILSLAKELHSQYDAHLGYANNWNAHELMKGQPVVNLDCLHWVSDSGVFRYILTKIYNKILQHESSLVSPRKYLKISRDLPDSTPIFDGSGRHGRETFIYLNGTKHKLANGLATFMRLGFSFDKTVHLSPLEFDDIDWGPDIS